MGPAPGRAPCARLDAGRGPCRPCGRNFAPHRPRQGRVGTRGDVGARAAQCLGAGGDLHFSRPCHGSSAGPWWIEEIFAWPGMGQLICRRFLRKDFPVIQALLLIIALLTVISSVLGDLAAAAIAPADPGGLRDDQRHRQAGPDPPERAAGRARRPPAEPRLGASSATTFPGQIGALADSCCWSPPASAGAVIAPYGFDVQELTRIKPAAQRGSSVRHGPLWPRCSQPGDLGIPGGAEGRLRRRRHPACHRHDAGHGRGPILAAGSTRSSRP